MLLDNWRKFFTARELCSVFVRRTEGGSAKCWVSREQEFCMNILLFY